LHDLLQLINFRPGEFRELSGALVRADPVHYRSDRAVEHFDEQDLFPKVPAHRIDYAVVQVFGLRRGVEVTTFWRRVWSSLAGSKSRTDLNASMKRSAFDPLATSPSRAKVSLVSLV
jgi:hypothetical protein